MKKCCKGESSAHSIPRTRFTNLLGSDRDKELRSSSEDAECNNEALTEESAGQRMIKCDGSSGSCPHNRQVGSCLWQLVNRLWRTRDSIGIHVKAIVEQSGHLRSGVLEESDKNDCVL